MKRVLLLWAVVMTRWGCYKKLWDLIGQLCDINVHAKNLGLHLLYSISTKNVFQASHVYRFQAEVVWWYLRFWLLVSAGLVGMVSSPNSFSLSSPRSCSEPFPI